MSTTPTRTHLSGETQAFRIVAYIEAVTYLMLLCATLIHRGFDGPDMVSALGPIHGIAFLVYLFLVLKIRAGQEWGFWRTVLIIVLAAVPLGGFWAGSHLKQEPTPRTTAGH